MRPARTVDEPVVAWKRAQVLLRPGDPEVRFAGTVRADLPYRADDVFRCDRGHRRLEPACSCGFYAVQRATDLRPSVVATALVEVELQGLVVRHRDCLRAERQRVRTVTFDGWCSFCVRPAEVLIGVRSLWADLPDPWLRAVPACGAHRRLFPVAATLRSVASVTDAVVRWERTTESRAARSLRRLYRSTGVRLR